MWITVGYTSVQTNNVVTIDTYCDSYDYGLIINGIKCIMGHSKHNSLKQINNILNSKVSEIIQEINK